MRNIDNVFTNRKIIIKETTKAIKVKVTMNDTNLAAWIAKQFVYPGKYENSVCIGIILDQSYELLVQGNDQDKVYAIITGKQLKDLLECQKKQFSNNADKWTEGIVPSWLQNKTK